jgi:peptidoglycan/xylan/chitin deacetylase (PgdA/CDA1 family)
MGGFYMKIKCLVIGKNYMRCTILVCIIFFISSFIIINFRGNTIEVSNTERLLPIYSVETNEKKVALTFDCAGGADDIASIIETLNTNDVKATFFVVGDWAKKYSGEMLALSKAGMEIRKSYP